MTALQTHLLAERYELRIKREDRRAGQIVAMIYNANRDSEKDPNGLDWLDFFPEWKPEVPEQSEEEMFETMMALVKRTEGMVS